MPEHESSSAATEPGQVGMARRWRLKMLAVVAAGGFAGTVARYQLGLWFPHPPAGWPVTTLTINVAGSFALGLLLSGLADGRNGWRHWLRGAAGTGFLGAFTTYSALAVDTDLLIRAGDFAMAAGYAAGSVVAGLMAAWAGAVAGPRLRPGGAGER